MAPNQAIIWSRFDWPTDNSFEKGRENSILRLGRVFGEQSARSLDALAARVAFLADAHIVHTRLYNDQWSKEREFLTKFLIESWLGLPRHPRRLPLVFLVTVEYRSPSHLLRGPFAAWRNRAVRNLLLEFSREFKEAFVFVRELKDVARHDVEQWSDSDVVQHLLNGADLREEIAHVFATKNAIAMRPLAKALLDILRRSKTNTPNSA